MTTLGLTAEPATRTDPQRVSTIREAASCTHIWRAKSVYDEQIQALVQQLFLRQDPTPVQHVGFTAVETQTDTAQLCLDVATALAATGSHDVGLIDAQLQSDALHTQLQIPAGNRAETSWLIAPRLWLTPRRSWLDDSPQWNLDSSLALLHRASLEFDFSILCLDPVSWLTAKLGQTCNGVVMMLTANKTRRLVAAQMQEQLRRAGVPLLGTVLADRRFPVPPGLYRNL